MGDEPAIAEIREREQSENDGGAGGDAGGDGGGSEGDQSGGGMFGGGVPTFGLSRKQLLLIGLVVVAVLAWKARDSSGGESSTKSAEEMEKARDPDLGDVKVREEEDANEPEVVLPANPEDELEKDQAIIDYFKEAGHISGGEDD